MKRKISLVKGISKRRSTGMITNMASLASSALNQNSVFNADADGKSEGNPIDGVGTKNKDKDKEKDNYSMMNVGIDINRLVNSKSYSNFDHLMKCKICFNIVVNPHDCETCGNTFCYDCAENFITENSNPNENFITLNSNPIESSNSIPCPFNCPQFNITPSSFAITSFLNKLKFKCLNTTCTEILTYPNVFDHDRECSHSFVNCPNVKCSKILKRQLLEHHVKNECEFSLSKCEICNQEFYRKDYYEHIRYCKDISSVMKLDNPVLDKCEKFSDLDLELQNLSLAGFLKMFVFQIAKSNMEVNKKFEKINNRVDSLRDEISNSICKNMLNIENMTNDIEGISCKFTNIENYLKQINRDILTGGGNGNNINNSNNKDFYNTLPGSVSPPSLFKPKNTIYDKKRRSSMNEAGISSNIKSNKTKNEFFTDEGRNSLGNIQNTQNNITQDSNYKEDTDTVNYNYNCVNTNPSSNINTFASTPNITKLVIKNLRNKLIPNTSSTNITNSTSINSPRIKQIPIKSIKTSLNTEINCTQNTANSPPWCSVSPRNYQKETENHENRTKYITLLQKLYDTQGITNENISQVIQRIDSLEEKMLIECSNLSIDIKDEITKQVEDVRGKLNNLTFTLLEAQ